MLVKDWMTSAPETVSVSTPVMEALQRLREGGYRRLPVMDGHKLVGIVTDRDLKEATPSKATTLSIYELNYLLSKLTVKDVMKSPVISIQADQAIEEAALLMEEHRISGLPVLDGTELIGIVTITDLMRAVTTFLGLREGGNRVTVRVPDKPGVMASIAQHAAPSNIVAVATVGLREQDYRTVVVRIAGEGADQFATRLREGGIEVIDER